MIHPMPTYCSARAYEKQLIVSLGGVSLGRFGTHIVGVLDVLNLACQTRFAWQLFV